MTPLLSQGLACCECGCGKLVNKGCRFIAWHQNKGKHNPNYGKSITEAIRDKQSKAKLSEKNPMWMGDKVGIMAIHDWVRRHKPKPEFCECCNKKHPYDLANISGEYKRDINDYEWLCRKCHMGSDGRMKKLSAFHFKKGHISWIKGLTKESDDRVKKISEAMKGKEGCWKGKKRPEHSERMKGKNNPMYGKIRGRDSSGRFLRV